MRRSIIRTGFALLVICAAAGPTASAPAQMTMPEEGTGQLQKWRDDIGKLTCSGECPGSFCCAA